MSRSSDSALGWTTEELWFDSESGFRYFKGSSPALEYGRTRIRWLQRALYLECEADHSPSVEVKNGWSYTFTSPHAFILCTGTALPDPFCVSVGNSLFGVIA
jgi:hypothetical protein